MRLFPTTWPRVVGAAAVLALGASGCGGSDSTTHGTSAAAVRYSREMQASLRSPVRVTPETPLPARDFKVPIAEYRRYAVRQLTLMQEPVARLQAALARDARPEAEDAWRAAFARYLRLGAVYGEFGALDSAIDGLPGGLPGGTGDPHFTGLHRLELGLWGGQPLASLEPVAARLATDIARLRQAVPTVTLPVLDYVTRAHEILEDAQRDFLSGTDVPWSGEGVLATESGLSATNEVLTTLSPVLDGDISNEVHAGLARLALTLDEIRRAHGGVLPTNAGLTRTEDERLSGVLGFSLESLQDVPGALETVVPPPTPRIPSS